MGIATKPQVNSLRTGTMAKSRNSSQHNQSEGPSQRYQEAKDLKISILEGHRPQVPKKPQTCSARNNEGLGTLIYLRAQHRTLLMNITEGVEGGQAGDGMNFITKVLSLRDLAVGSHWQGRIVLWGEST